MPVSVLGFGDRQFPAFCGYAEALDRALRTAGWPLTMPLECIHQQSAQQFARWGAALSEALGETLTLEYVPRVPETLTLERSLFDFSRSVTLSSGCILAAFTAQKKPAAPPPTTMGFLFDIEKASSHKLRAASGFLYNNFSVE